VSLPAVSTSADVAVEGVRLRLHRAEPARARRTTPVLLLHGFPHTARAWGDLMPELARDRVVLAPDLKGLGASEAAGRYDVSTVVAELAALVLHEVDAPVDLVGHGIGGSLALAFAAVRPDLVRRLVVVSAPRTKADLWRVWRLLGPTRRGGPAIDPGDRLGLATMLAYYRGALGWRAGKVVAPVRPEVALVLWGAADPVLSIAVGQAIARALGPGAVTVTLPGVGHWPLEEAPTLAGRIVAEFLRAPAASAAPTATAATRPAPAP